MRMNKRWIGFGVALLLVGSAVGCAATVQTDDAPSDGSVDPTGTTTAAVSAAPTMAPTTSPTSIPIPTPTEDDSSAWNKPNPNGKADGAKCSKPDDCKSGVCEGEGCDPATTKAVCVAADRMCTRDYRTYCGCDGKEFGGSGSCPGRMYQSASACNTSAASASDGGAAVKDFEAAAVKACACKDMDCYKKVTDSLSGLQQKYKDAVGSEADAERIVEAGKKMADCGMKLQK